MPRKMVGFDAVRNIALTVLMFEHMQNKGNATVTLLSFDIMNDPNDKHM